jgi:hypothetical protein
MAVKASVKRGILIQIAEGDGFSPEEYQRYFEDEKPWPDKEMGKKARFVLAANGGQSFRKTRNFDPDRGGRWFFTGGIPKVFRGWKTMARQ